MTTALPFGTPVGAFAFFAKDLCAKMLPTGAEKNLDEAYYVALGAYIASGPGEGYLRWGMDTKGIVSLRHEYCEIWIDDTDEECWKLKISINMAGDTESFDIEILFDGDDGIPARVTVLKFADSYFATAFWPKSVLTILRDVRHLASEHDSEQLEQLLRE